MIFAAGLGTRLRPFTNDRPKALVEINGVALLELAIQKLIHFNFREIIINIHHYGELIIDFLNRNENFGINIHISDERDLLLNTGGGLKKALSLLGDEPFLVYNTDVLTNLDLALLYQNHIQRNPLATLAIRKRESSRYLLFNSGLQLSGWRNVKTGEQRISRHCNEFEDFGFSGIHVIDPAIIQFMPNEAVFSIIDVYLEAAKDHVIDGFDHSDSFWMDVGRVKDLEKAKKLPKII